MEVSSNVMKQFADDQALQKIQIFFFRYTRFLSMNAIQYTNNLYPKSCNVLEAFNEATISNMFVKGADSSFWLSLREY